MMKKIIPTTQALSLQVFLVASLGGLSAAHASQVDFVATCNSAKAIETIPNTTQRHEKAATIKSPALNQLLKDAQAHKPNTNDAEDNRLLAKFTYGHSNPINLSKRKTNFVLQYLFGG